MARRSFTWASLAALVAALAGCGHGSERPPAPRTFELVGYPFVRAGYDGAASSLRRVDPVTLGPFRRHGLRLGDYVTGPVLSPDRRLAAFSGSFGQVVLVDLVHLRRLGEVQFGGPDTPVSAIGWPNPDLIVAVRCTQRGKECFDRRIVLLDPERRRVRRTIRLPGGVASAYDAVHRRTVFLADARANGVAPARLLVVDADGSIRTVVLRPVRTGRSAVVQPGLPAGYERYRAASVAVDPIGGRAFVVSPYDPLAEIDLASLRVGYRRVAGLDPPPRQLARAPRRPWTGTANPSEGKMRTAVWLGRARLLVSGRETRLSAPGPMTRAADLPARIVDVSQGAVVRVLPAGWLQVAGGLLLVDGRGGMVSAYASDGRLRWRRQIPGYWQVLAGHLYGGRRDGTLTRAYDLRSGRPLRAIRPRLVTQEVFRWRPPASG
jgi:hypothetical protein